MVKRSGLQLTDLTMPGWSKILWDKDGAWKEVTPVASAPFLPGLWMRSNARGLSSPGLGFTIVMIS
jgi:hypothetical protein